MKKKQSAWVLVGYHLRGKQKRGVGCRFLAVLCRPSKKRQPTTHSCGLGLKKSLSLGDGEIIAMIYN